MNGVCQGKKMNKMVRTNLGIDSKRLTSLYAKSLEAKEYFLKKLVEEATEVAEAKTEKELHDELGDLIQVLKDFLDTGLIDKERVSLSRRLKKKEKGGFLDWDYVYILDKE